MGFVCRMQQQYEEERLQRLVQEEAVKFLWKEVSVRICHLSLPRIHHSSVISYGYNVGLPLHTRVFRHT